MTEILEQEDEIKKESFIVSLKKEAMKIVWPSKKKCKIKCETCHCFNVCFWFGYLLCRFVCK